VIADAIYEFCSAVTGGWPPGPKIGRLNLAGIANDNGKMANKAETLRAGGYCGGVKAMLDRGNAPSEAMGPMMEQGIEQARRAMENYLQFFQKGMSSSPWAGSELNKKITGCVQKNVTTAFDFAQKLAQAKDPLEILRLQIEFFQTQLEVLTEQMKDLGDAATKATTTAFNGFQKPSS
jgi:hypothetical protein